MTIYEFADIIDATLLLTRYSNQNGRWCARFGAEVKEGAILAGTHGNGATPEEAIAAYVRQIEGKLLVFDAYGPARREYHVPANLDALTEAAS